MHNGFCWVFLKRIEFIPFVVAAFWNFHNFYVAFRLDVGRGHIFHFLCCWCFMLFAFAAHFRHFIDDNRKNKLETQTTIEIRNDKRRHSASKTAETKKKTTARAMNMFCCVIFGVWSFDIYSRWHCFLLPLFKMNIGKKKKNIEKKVSHSMWLLKRKRILFPCWLVGNIVRATFHKVHFALPFVFVDMMIFALHNIHLYTRTQSIHFTLCLYLSLENNSNKS